MDELAVGLLGVGGVVAGALVAMLGGILAERRRQQGVRQLWRLDVRLDVYWRLLESSRRMRNSSYRAVQLGSSPGEEHRHAFTEAVARAELVASEAVIGGLRHMSQLAHDDYYAAQPKDARDRDPHVRLRAGDRTELVPIEEWHAARHRLTDALRADLGMEPVETSVWSQRDP